MGLDLDLERRKINNQVLSCDGILGDGGLSGASKRVEILEFGACATPFLSLRVRRGDLMEGLQRD